MKVEQLNPLQIDWTKPQVVVNEGGDKFMVITNHKPFDENCFSGYEISTGCIHENVYKSSFKPEKATEYPIELKLTIETPQELCDLWHRLNISNLCVMEHSDECLEHDAIYDPLFFKKIAELAKERNLYKND